MTIRRLSVVVTMGMLLFTFLGCSRDQKKGTEEKQFQRQAERIKPSEVEDTKTKISLIDGAPMAMIPAGEFQMGSNHGSDDEQPVHTVYLDAFYIDKYEVTNAQYKKFMDATGHNRNYASMKECNHRAGLHQLLGAAYQVVNSAVMGIYGQ